MYGYNFNALGCSGTSHVSQIRESIILSLPPEAGVQAFRSHKCYFKRPSARNRHCWFLKDKGGLGSI
jgi:hypothetical protein